MARPEHQGLAAIDDIAAEVSQIRQSVRILATRWRGRFHREDLNELSNILDMCDAIQASHRDARAVMAAQFQKGGPL